MSAAKSRFPASLAFGDLPADLDEHLVVAVVVRVVGVDRCQQPFGGGVIEGHRRFCRGHRACLLLEAGPESARARAVVMLC
jgi:hypothetical protein